jgi:putative transposase
MPRQLRVDDRFGFFHVTTRGNNRQPIFFADRDREVFIAMLGRLANKYRWVVLSYCLMTNHYHVVLTTPEGGVSAGMQELNGGYSRRTNRLYGRTGHLLHNRFGAEAIQTDRHLLEACRYVVLNPIRAGLCSQPHEWRWSSYRATVGLDHPPRWLAVGEVLELFDAQPRRARAAFRSFVAEGRERTAAVSDTVTESARAAAPTAVLASSG